MKAGPRTNCSHFFPTNTIAGPTTSSKSFWQQEQAKTGSTTDFETWWRQSVHDGFIPNTALPAKTFPSKRDFTQPVPIVTTELRNTADSGFELVFRTDPSIYDGRFANNGWLQELPKPLTKVTWDNVALVSPNTAQQITRGRKRQARSKDANITFPRSISSRSREPALRVPLWVMPGQPDGVVTIHLGYGRRLAGRVGSGRRTNAVGFDAYSIRTSFEPWSSSGIQSAKVRTDRTCSRPRNFTSISKIRTSAPSSATSCAPKHSNIFSTARNTRREHEHPSIYPDYDYKNQAENAPNYAWGMAIDLNNCIGCNGCTVACQAENNIPVVGKDEVVRSREMHWIRIDTYFKGFDPNHPKARISCPCRACIAKTRRANRFVRFTPPCTARKA